MIRSPFRSGARISLGGRILIGGFLLLAGVVLVGAASGYYVYSRRAVASLEGLDIAAPASPAQGLPEEWRLSQGGGGDTPGPVASTGLGVSPRGGELRWSDWNTLPKTQGEAPKATRVVIPAIRVDSPMVEVAIVQDDGEWVWQRPKQSVGHHIGTANPGEVGNVVISGHINSPIRGEGDVFKRLPEIPKRIQAGEAVEIFLSTPDTTYVYRVVASLVVKPEDVRVFDPTDKPSLTIITCVPDYVFSDRLVLTALLVKVADGGYPPVEQRSEGPVVSPV